jgi:hypothetical protein
MKVQLNEIMLFFYSIVTDIDNPFKWQLRPSNVGTPIGETPENLGKELTTLCTVAPLSSLELDKK